MIEVGYVLLEETYKVCALLPVAVEVDGKGLAVEALNGSHSFLCLFVR